MTKVDRDLDKIIKEEYITYVCTGTESGGGNSITFFIEAECIKVAYKMASDKIHEVLGHQTVVEVKEVRE